MWATEITVIIMKGSYKAQQVYKLDFKKETTIVYRFSDLFHDFQRSFSLETYSLEISNFRFDRQNYNKLPAI